MPHCAARLAKAQDPFKDREKRTEADRSDGGRGLTGPGPDTDSITRLTVRQRRQPILSVFLSD